MTKFDLMQDMKHLYQAKANDVVQVDVPAFNFLIIDGKGDPNSSPAYVAAAVAVDDDLTQEKS